MLSSIVGIKKKKKTAIFVETIYISQINNILVGELCIQGLKKFNQFDLLRLSRK